ncbi:folylpolyglutamate synthase/dihydrofolate synthase family protein [uncultured Paraglaciecola sp.]|uniref:bifunctional folylpolyglutamate synthase/dihydrofolate synthase n=1 Tax=uncultured Paraglaciecola sp. TaxID=1765024 RepID=UPI002607C8A3|nr:folylpolyglutamate synthase/dihydrofolate synthase family protein [uncultured Paraglaciecola sp.]
MKHESLAAWLQWLEQQHSKEIDMGLSRVAEVAARLQLTPQFHASSKVVTVAGTNGKGSFVTTLQTLLLAQGKSVASYTSPHLLTFNERMVINGVMASDEQIMQAFELVYAALEDTSLSYFEYTTLAAMVLFQQQNVEYCIFEVGLGGRLDAVNILPPDYAVITSIGIDHCDYLGDTLEAIAAEKCGILRENTPLICAEAQAPKFLQEACNHHPSAVINDDFCYQYLPASANENQQWQYSNKHTHTDYGPLPDNGLSLSSQAAALYFVEQTLGLGLTQPVLDSLHALSLAGRFQRFQKEGVEIVLDVAHNVQAVSLLKQRLALHLPLAQGKKRIAVFAMLKDKDVTQVIGLLKDDIAAWFVGDLKHERALAVTDLANIVHEQGIHMISVSKNMRQAFARAQSLCEPGDQIVVLGSFFTVAEILPKLEHAKRH